MSAVRGILVDRPNDKESHYVCDCGFDEYIGETCNCDTCKELDKNYGLPLKNCPSCGTEFEIVE